jgi:hypothetical protein
MSTGFNILVIDKLVATGFSNRQTDLQIKTCTSFSGRISLHFFMFIFSNVSYINTKIFVSRLHTSKIRGHRNGTGPTAI